jgi:hypothetical protein
VELPSQSAGDGAPNGANLSKRRNKKLDVLAIGLMCLAPAVLPTGSMAFHGPDQDTASDQVIREAFGGWIQVGVVVDVIRACLLAATAIQLLRRAPSARPCGLALGFVGVVRAVGAFILVESSLRPLLGVMSVGDRDSQLLGAYVEGGLIVQMVLGTLGLVIAVLVLAVVHRGIEPPPVRP